ncbi:MAG: response regulator [Lentisphaerae bacterium]|nr:response regulator [Lentisphaerota bacterium]
MTDTNQPKVLIADDDQLVCKVLTIIFSKLGMRCLRAQTGSEAIDMLKDTNNLFALMILDLVLPGKLTGWEVLTTVRDCTHLASMPIIVMTGANISEHETKKLLEKAQVVVQKRDFAVESFSKLVINMLNKEPS